MPTSTSTAVIAIASFKLNYSFNIVLYMRRLISSVGILFLITACSSPDPIEDYASRPDFDQLPVFEIEQLFEISDFNDGDFFASVTQVVSGEDGTILVSDSQAKKIYLFDETGAYLSYLGGEGAGPGEFRQIGRVSLLAPDTLQAVDWQLARITFFSLQDGNWTAVKYHDRPSGAREYGSDIFFTFDGLYPRENGYLARFNSSFTPVDTATHSFAYYSKLDFDLQQAENQEYYMHVVTKPVVNREGVRSVSVMSLPESHRTHYSNTADGFKISNWSGNNQIIISHITRGDSSSFKFASNRVPFLDEEIRAIIDRQIPDPENSMFSRDQTREALPKYRGFSRQLILDDLERIWILTRPFQVDDPEWLIYSKSGNLLAAAPHPGGTVSQIKNNRMYVRLSTPDGEPAFGAYRLHE
ncbi:MAG: 6-bladed beta-propeller [Balneolales bacterium]|nr:6-bladed beta-propeller [Balneolales bacterium]